MAKALTGIAAARRAAEREIAALEARMASNIRTLLQDADDQLKALTPVWSGQAVRNYIWTVDQPNHVTYEPIDNGDPGPTNSMPLGVEPRRGVNEAAASESLARVLGANPFSKFYCTNNSPDIQGLELGLLPGPPLKSRSHGMFGLTEAYLGAKVAAKGITK